MHYQSALVMNIFRYSWITAGMGLIWNFCYNDIAAVGVIFYVDSVNIRPVNLPVENCG